ncbi:hypothetical protein GC174_16370 [bacterium]|nr:hypothetical protein [bacterium]
MAIRPYEISNEQIEEMSGLLDVAGQQWTPEITNRSHTQPVQDSSKEHLPVVELDASSAVSEPEISEPQITDSGQSSAVVPPLELSETTAPAYVNPYTRSMQERVEKLQREAPEGFNSSGEGTAAINSLQAEIAPYDKSELVDGEGRLRATANMETEIGSHTESVYSDPDITRTQFLFFSSTQMEDHPEQMMEMASEIKRDQDAYRVLQLAEKVQDPTLRRALQLTVFEEYMQRVDGELEEATGPFFNIAYDAVFGEDGRSAAEKLQDRRSRQEFRKADLARPREGLNEVEQQELAGLLPHIASAREFWENVRRVQHDW